MATRHDGVSDDPHDADGLPLHCRGAAGSCALEDSLRRIVTEAMAVGFDDLKQKITSSQNVLTARIEPILAALEAHQGPVLPGGGSKQPNRPAQPPGSSRKAHGKPVMAWSSLEVVDHREAVDGTRSPTDHKTVHVMPPLVPPAQLDDSGSDRSDAAGRPLFQSGAPRMKTAANAALATLRCRNTKKPNRNLDRGALALTFIDEEVVPPTAYHTCTRQSSATLSTQSVGSAISAAIMTDLVPARPSGIDVYTLDALHTDRMLECSFGVFEGKVLSPGPATLSDPPSENVSAESSVVLADRTQCILPPGKISSDDSSPSRDESLGGNAFGEAETVFEKPHGSMDGLRRAQETELMSQVQLHTLRHRDLVIDGVCLSAGATGWTVQVPACVLGAYGIVPGQAGAACRWHLGAVVLAQASLLAAHAHLTASNPRFRYMHLSEMCPAVGGLLGLVLLRCSQIDALLGPAQMQLARYAKGFGFHREWLRKSLQSFAQVAALWLCFATASSALMIRLGEVCADHVLGIVGCNALGLLYNTVGVGLFAALTYCQIHVCVALEMMVDKFCVRFFEAPDFSTAVNEWTVLQAILRRAANAIDSSILAMQTSLLGALLLMAAELFVGDGGPRGTNAALGAVSNLSLALLSLYGLFRAAAVTEKCSRVPALLNSLRFDGSPINFERQYVVTYVEQSAAGFYIRGVRLTTFMVLKMAYVSGMVAFAFVTNNADA